MPLDAIAHCVLARSSRNNEIFTSACDEVNFLVELEIAELMSQRKRRQNPTMLRAFSSRHNVARKMVSQQHKVRKGADVKKEQACTH